MKPHILIGVPSNGEWKADFGVSLSSMCMQAIKHGDKEVTVASCKGSMLSCQRHDLVMEAKKINATHLLFLDSDLTFPETALDQLLFWNKPVVGVNYVMKVIPTVPTTRKWKNGKWEFVVTTKKSKGLEEVQRMPTGMMLMEMGIFEQVEQPWFAFKWCGVEDKYQGEDWTFCEAIEEAGIPMYVDHELSWRIGHVGNFSFKNGHVRPEMFNTRERKHYRNFKERGL
jgi:hypothetical protein